jgi:hypothetical protein
MTDQIEIKIEDLKRVALEQGDKIVAKIPWRAMVDEEQCDWVRQQLESEFPGHRVLLIPAEMELAIVRPTDPEDQVADGPGFTPSFNYEAGDTVDRVTFRMPCASGVNVGVQLREPQVIEHAGVYWIHCNDDHTYSLVPAE